MASILLNLPTYLLIVQSVLSVAVGVCLLIPGPEPEASLQKIVNFLSKFSRKPPQ